MGKDARGHYSAEDKARALAIYVEQGPAEAARATGIKDATIRSWAKRAGMAAPRAEVTRAAVKAAQESWLQRRGELRDASGAAAEEFLKEARAKMKSSARSATDLIRAFSILVTTANTLAVQTAGEPGGPQTREEFDAEVDKLIDEMMSAAEKKARQELLDRDERDGRAGRTVARDTPRSSAAQNGAGGGNDSDVAERPAASAPARQSPTPRP